MDESGFNLLSSKQLLIVLGICAVILCGVTYYWWRTTMTPKYTPEQLQAINQAEQRLLAQISTSTEAVTLKDTIPTASAQVTNPVDSVYRNPFK